MQGFTLLDTKQLMRSLSDVIRYAKKRGLKVVNHNKRHNYLILTDGTYMVCVNHKLTVDIKSPAYYINDAEYNFNFEIKEWLRLDKIRYLTEEK